MNPVILLDEIDKIIGVTMELINLMETHQLRYTKY